MKNFSKLVLGLGLAVAMTACSSEDVTAPAATTDLTITVNTGEGLASRALNTVNGYELKCVMQLMDENGATVGSQAVASAAAGKASFVIKAADIDAGASTALFWAEYVPVAENGTKVYNSADLTNISYQVTTFDMTNADLMAAADAFAGKITTLTNGASVTLTRPMIQFNFAPTNPSIAAAATTYQVSYTATSGYNVLTGNCDAAAAQALVYTNATFVPAMKGNWFSSYIIAPANMAKFDQPITMVLGGGFDKTLTIEANTLPLDANYIVNTTAEIAAGGDQTLDVNVNVGINGDFENEPKPAVFEVGAYVDAAGLPTNDKDAAVGIVYHVGAIAGDEISLYPAEFAGKTIKGYVVATENVAKARQQFNADKITDGLTPCEGIINGTQNSATVLEALGESAFATAWNTWVGAHALSGDNHTAWYLPARLQMEVWFSMLMPTTNLKNELVDAETSDAFKALFPLDTIFDRTWSGCMYATCAVNSGGNIQGASLSINEDGSNPAVRFAQIDIKTKTQSVLGRAMFTVFE